MKPECSLFHFISDTAKDNIILQIDSIDTLKLFFNRNLINRKCWICTCMVIECLLLTTNCQTLILNTRNVIGYQNVTSNYIGRFSVNEEDLTPLDMAVMLNHVPMTKFLLHHGARENPKCKFLHFYLDLQVIIYHYIT